jgi:hypothetical protein
MADAKKLLDNSLKIVAKDIRAINKESRKGKLDPATALTLTRYLGALDSIVKQNSKEEQDERKRVSELTDEQLRAMAAEVVNGKK